MAEPLLKKGSSGEVVRQLKQALKDLGFDPGAVDQRAGPGERVGLAGMEERIALLGGELQVRSSPGEGTRISASVPLA